MGGIFSCLTVSPALLSVSGLREAVEPPSGRRQVGSEVGVLALRGVDLPGVGTLGEHWAVSSPTCRFVIIQAGQPKQFHHR